MGADIDAINEFEEVLDLDPTLTKDNKWVPAKLTEPAE
jgi:hypothetical protein